MAIDEFREELVAVVNSVDIPTPKYLPATLDARCALIDYEVGEAISFQHGAYELTWRVGLCYPFAAQEDAQAFFDFHKDPFNTRGLYRTLLDTTWTEAHYVKPTNAGMAQFQQIGQLELLIADFSLEVVL